MDKRERLQHSQAHDDKDGDVEGGEDPQALTVLTERMFLVEYSSHAVET